MSSDILKKGKLAVVFLFFIFCPILFTEELIDPSNAIRALILSVLLLIFLVAPVSRQLFIPPFYFRLFFFLYFAVAAAGWFFALNSAEVLAELEKLFLFYVTICVSLTVWRDQKEILGPVLNWVSLTVILSFSVLLFNLPDLSRKTLYSFTLFYEHKNILSEFLFILLAFISLQIGRINQKSDWIPWLNFTGLLVLIALLQARSVYIAIIVSAAILLYFWLRTKNKIGIFLPALVFLTAGLFLLGPSKFYIWLRPYLGSTEERIQFWKKSAEVFFENPFFGVGSGNWQFNFTKSGIEGIANLEKGITAQHPHNEIISILSENGILGGIAVFLLIAFLFRHVRYDLSTSSTRQTKIYFAFLCGFFVESCFAFPKERYLILVPFAVLLAGLLDHLKMSTSNKNGGTARKFLIAGLVLTLLITVMRIRGEFYTKELLASQQTGDASGMLRAGKKAYSPFYLTDPTSSPIAGYLGAAYFAKGNVDSLLYFCRKAAEIAPYDYEVQSNLGFALTRAGKSDEARLHIQEALRLNPRDEGAWLNLVVLEYSLKNYEDGLNALMQIPDFEKKYPDHLAALQKGFAEVLNRNP